MSTEHFTPSTIRLPAGMKIYSLLNMIKAVSLVAVSSMLFLACGSSDGVRSDQSAPSNAEDLVGDWTYEVVGIDNLNLRTGVIRFILEDGQLSGMLDAIHLDLAPLRNIRYHAGEATFTAQAFPGYPGGLAFSMFVEGTKMTGQAYPTSDSQAVATRAKPSSDRNTVEIVARK